jgi:polysaccharide biosynthesis transport protein
MVIIGVVSVMLGAFVLSTMQDPIYRAESQMLVQSRGTEALFGNTQNFASSSGALATEVKVVESPIVSNRVIEDLGIEGPIPAATGTQIGQTNVVAVSVRSGDPETARILADAYVQAYIDIRREQAVDDLLAAGDQLSERITEIEAEIEDLDEQIADTDPGETVVLATLETQRQALINRQLLYKERLDQLQVDAALKTGGAQSIRKASTPGSPVEPTTSRSLALALVVGLLLGLGAAFLADYTDDSIRSVSEMERMTGLPVLSVVPSDPPPDNRPISISRPNDFAVETYRTLRTNVTFMGVDKPLRVLQITSPLATEGKTTTATNLAVVLAQAGDSVLLIDADLRKPRVHDVFGVDGSRGLTNVLLGEAPELFTHIIDDKLSLLCAGEVPPNPSEMLSSRRLVEVLNAVREQYDWIVLDSAPLLPVSDSVALSRSVDGTVIVTQAGRTTRRQLMSAADQLHQVSASIVGLVFNRVSAKGRGYGSYGSYGSYGGYGGYGGYGSYGYGGYGRPASGTAVPPDASAAAGGRTVT